MRLRLKRRGLVGLGIGGGGMDVDAEGASGTEAMVSLVKEQRFVCEIMPCS